MIVWFIWDLEKNQTPELQDSKTPLSSLNNFEMCWLGKISSDKSFWKMIECDLTKIIYSITLIMFFYLYFCYEPVFYVLYNHIGEQNKAKSFNPNT